MSEEPENLMLHLLREMRREIGDIRETMDTKLTTKDDLADVRSEMKSLRADVAADIHNLDAKIDKTRKDLGEQIVGLRGAVVEYHSSVIGHGMIISELEARMRRVEQHLELPPIEAH